MRIVFSMDEVRAVLRQRVLDQLGRNDDLPALVRFVHVCPDGSGEMDVDQITRIDRVEVELRRKDGSSYER